MPPKEKPATTAATTNNATEIDNKKPTGNPKRQKIVKACKDCRRRKVKCDGATPCGTCRRSSIQCIFESTTPKRGTSKHYIESLENRLSVMEKAMNSLSGPTAQLVKEAVRRQEEQLQLQQQLQQVAQDTTTSSSPVLNQQQQPEFIHPEDRYMINEFGSPSYIQDISFMDNNNMNMNTYRGGYYTQDSSQSTTSSSSPKSVSSQNSMTRYSNMDEIEIQNHLKFYLIQIQPYFPLFVPSFFNRQYAAQELPKILIYAMCALSCIFQQLEEHHNYYQRATIMLDEAIGKPSIALVQTLLLLVKYKEYHCEQYFEKTKSLMARTIEVCKILNLHGLNTKALDPMTETRKRTFCMVFTYNTLLCVEQGVMNDLLLSTITQDHLPVTVADESTVDCQRYIIQFSCTLDQIHRHMSRISQRQEIQKELRDEQQVIEENLALFQLQVKIENDLLHLPSNLTMNNQQQQLHKHQPSFPAEDIVMTVSPMTRLLHMLYHLNVILLHFHYAKYPLPQLPQGDLPVYPHGIMCASSASHMIRLVEGLVSDPSQSYRYAPRGLQFVAHCMTSALTVLQFETSIKSNSKVHMDEYQRCAVLTQQIATASPSNEMRSYSRELDLSSLDVSSLKVSSSTTPSTSPSPIMNYPMVASPISTESVPLPVPKMRRNTISHRPQQPPQQQQQQMVPPALLQLSSTGVSQQFTSMQQQQQQQHHPLHNIHATPLQMQQQHMQMQTSPVPQLLRGSTQSCNDLRSMNRLHKVSPPPPPPLATQFTSNSFTQHRKPVGSVISSSTASSTQQGPYRGTGIRNVSPSLPYGTPTMTQSSGFPRQQIQQPGKMKRIKKSVSIHGISSTYRQQQQQQQQYQLFQQQQQQHQQFQFQQQLNNLLGGNSMLHRPYQPTFDDQKYITDDDFAMNVDDLNFLSNYPTLDDGQRSEGHLL